MSRYGRRAFPRSVVIVVGCGFVTFLGCLGVNALVGPPYFWAWMIGIALFVMLMIAGFLWVRLTPDAPSTTTTGQRGQTQGRGSRPGT